MTGAAAYRSAVSGQIRAARAAWPDPVECARCHNVVPKAEAHVDHHPIPLAVLIRAFLDLATLGMVTADRAAWRTYHAREATLTPACPGCNIAANDRGTPWHRRRRATW
jgi:5-methylcytosine-specific restriction endonuclease McrA